LLYFSKAVYYSNKVFNTVPGFDGVKNELHPENLKETEK